MKQKEIKLRNVDISVIVDEEDYDRLSKFKWYNSAGYARRSVVTKGNRLTITMHRDIINAPKGYDVDHINGDPFDNRKSNLRVCTTRQNIRNMRKTRGSSRFKGVHWHKRYKIWQASIGMDYKLIFWVDLLMRLKLPKYMTKRQQDYSENLPRQIKAWVYIKTERKMTDNQNKFREKLAALAHEQWSGWMEYLFGLCLPEKGYLIIPKWAVERWKRQLKTKYSKLSEQEKDSDRKEADKVLSLVSSCLPENNYTGQGSEYNRGKFDGVDETIKLMKERLGIK